MQQLPDLKKTDYNTLDGTIALTTWQGFSSKLSIFQNQDSSPDNEYSISFRLDDEQTKPSGAQIKAYEYLINNQEEVKVAMLKLLLEEYNNEIFEAYEGIDAQGNPLPEITQTSDFQNLIGLSKIYIHYIEKSGQSYIGFQFDCSWDTEHDLGAMTHLDRIVQVGGADVSFLEWVAERDKK